MFAYEQCLLCMAHHPDIWIEAAVFLEQASKLLGEKGVSDVYLRITNYQEHTYQHLIWFM